MKKLLVMVVVFFSITLGFTLTHAKMPSYSDLCKQLKELKGWQAESCHGMNMSGSPMGEIASATRSYTKGEKQLEAVILCGMQAMSYWAPFSYKMQMETDEEFIKVTTVDGYDVGISYNKKGKNGSIIVCLKKSQNAIFAVFCIHFDNMGWKEALDLAKQFDWKTMEKLF